MGAAPTPSVPAPGPSPIPAGDHEAYMRLCLSLADLAPKLPTNFRVGAVLLSASTNTILATGHTMELPGNTHAEQCALSKYAAAHGLPEERVGELLGQEAGEVVIYTTVEPCAKRLSGNLPCVERILRTRENGGGIRRVYVGVKEPETFVGENMGRRKLEEAGVEVVVVEGLEEEILRVAEAGHVEKATENR